MRENFIPFDCTALKHRGWGGQYAGKKKPGRLATTGPFGNSAWRCPTFAREPALSSALKRFTALFGMGRGGTTSLWLPGNSVVGDRLPAQGPQSVIDEFWKKYKDLGFEIAVKAELTSCTS